MKFHLQHVFSSEVTLAEPYNDMFYSTELTLTESNIGVFSCSEVTLCRISARWSVVSPSSSSTLRSAPLLTRSSTMEVWPWDTARSSGVCWRLFLISMLAWPCRHNLINHLNDSSITFTDGRTFSISNGSDLSCQNLGFTGIFLNKG